MGERAKATVTETPGSHVVLVSRPAVVAAVISQAALALTTSYSLVAGRTRVGTAGCRPGIGADGDSDAVGVGDLVREVFYVALGVRILSVRIPQPGSVLADRGGELGIHCAE